MRYAEAMAEAAAEFRAWDTRPRFVVAGPGFVLPLGTGAPRPTRCACGRALPRTHRTCFHCRTTRYAATHPPCACGRPAKIGVRCGRCYAHEYNHTKRDQAKRRATNRRIVERKLATNPPCENCAVRPRLIGVLCQSCYHYRRRHGKPRPATVRRDKHFCWCGAPVHCHGLCRPHYWRIYRLMKASAPFALACLAGTP